MPRAMPKLNSTSRKGISISPSEKNDKPNTAVASTSITTRPTTLVPMLVITSPVMYSGVVSGVAKRLRKFLDHTSSRNAVLTPCMIRVKKSHSSTAPSRLGT